LFNSLLAVHHDPEIDGLGPLWSLGVPDLPAHVPLLPDVLAVCEGMVVNVEVKGDPGGRRGHPELVAAEVAREIAGAGWTDRVIVSSFEVPVLHAVQRADDRLALGELWTFMSNADAGLLRATEAGWTAVHPFVTDVTADLVERAHAVGLAINVWTVNAAHDLTAFVALGVDAVITDNLAEAVAIGRVGLR
jgi:glycerophosphoryl diester phosphodiesterase